MDDFKLVFTEGKLIAIVTVNGFEYSKEVTEYFEKENPHDSWLDYRLNI